jgi:hypothetical protein
VREAVKKMDGWKRVGRGPPFRDDLRAEAEESLLLEAVTSERLVQTQMVGKDLACAVLICEFVEISDDAVIACSFESCI